MKKENEKSEEKEIIVENQQEKLNEEIENNKVNQEEIVEEIKEDNNIEQVIEEIEEDDSVKEKQETENKEEVKVEKQVVEEDKKTFKDAEKEIEDEREKGKKSKKTIILVTILIVILLFLSTIFAIININNNNIIKGIRIEDVDVSDLSKEEVGNLINEKVYNIENIEVYYGDYSEVIKLKDIGIEINAKEAINKAITVGKSNNIIFDNYNILKANIFKTKFELNVDINQEKFKEMVKNIQVELPEAIKEYSYEIKDNELIITNGKPGIAVDEEQLKEEIVENIKDQFNGNNKSMDIPVKYATPEKIDIDKIYNEIYKKAKDAYIVEEPFELHKEENGIDFNISIEEAKQIVLEDKESYTIPLKITKPKVAVKDLGDKLFKQTLSKYTTIYDAGDINRGINIGLAAKAINGTILLPGETFSYNGKIGDTTKEKGYRTGGAYVGGKVVQAYGGGICQLSSTLYNAALYANLEIVQRYNHSYAVGYVPAGRDATVSYGGKDFKFKNTRSYPIKIVAGAKNGVVSVSILGIKEAKEYEIVLTSSVLSTTPYKTTYEENSSLQEGKEKVIQKGYNGKTSVAYKIVKLNGKTISKTLLSKDTYKPMNRIVQVGTKKAATKPVTAEPSTNSQQPVQTPSVLPSTMSNTVDTSTSTAVNVTTQTPTATTPNN